MSGARAKLERSFRGVLLAGHKGAAVEVPFDPAEAWKLASTPLWKGRRGHRVAARVNGVAFESTIVARSKRFWLLVDDATIASARAAVGSEVRVVLAPLVAEDE